MMCSGWSSSCKNDVVLNRRCLQCCLVILTAITGLAAQQRRHEKKQDLPPGKDILWIDPGDPSLLDFEYGPGGRENQPQPPFVFIDEDMSGTHAKVNVK